MIQTVRQIRQHLDRLDFDKLWLGFQATPFLIYDSDYFYADQPVPPELATEPWQGIYRGRCQGRLMGNTALKLGYTTLAIWDMRTIPADFSTHKLASLIVHEMFHAFQMASGEQRFPNELLGLDYPITRENIALRTRERDHLFQAASQIDTSHLAQFFSLRRQRKAIIGSFLAYEEAIETVEGTAVYVEFQALSQLVPQTSLGDFLGSFREVSADNLKIRNSSYHQGLLLSLLADQLIPDWKSGFLASDEYLSPMIEHSLALLEVTLDPEEVNSHLEEVLAQHEQARQQVFHDFANTPRENFVDRDIELTGFDPMNVIKCGREVIHLRFVRVKIDGQEKMLAGPVKMTIGQNLFDVVSLEW